MTDKKLYHRKYMEEYRKTHFLTVDQKERRSAAVRKCLANKRKDPIWVEKERKRTRELARKKRLDPEYRKLCVQKHMMWAKKNKEHLKAYIKQRRNTNPLIALKAKKYLLLKKYGMTYEEYQKRRTTQNERCPICTEPLGTGAVDHSHITNKVRDIICDSCNRWIGFLEKNRNLVEPMLKYLDEWAKIHKMQVA